SPETWDQAHTPSCSNRWPASRSRRDWSPHTAARRCGPWCRRNRLRRGYWWQRRAGPELPKRPWAAPPERAAGARRAATRGGGGKTEGSFLKDSYLPWKSQYPMCHRGGKTKYASFSRARVDSNFNRMRGRGGAFLQKSRETERKNDLTLIP